MNGESLKSHNEEPHGCWNLAVSLIFKEMLCPLRFIQFSSRNYAVFLAFISFPLSRHCWVLYPIIFCLMMIIIFNYIQVEIAAVWKLSALMNKYERADESQDKGDAVCGISAELSWRDFNFNWDSPAATVEIWSIQHQTSSLCSVGLNEILKCLKGKLVCFELNWIQFLFLWQNEKRKLESSSK